MEFGLLINIFSVKFQVSEDKNWLKVVWCLILSHICILLIVCLYVCAECTSSQCMTIVMISDICFLIVSMNLQLSITHTNSVRLFWANKDSHLNSPFRQQCIFINRTSIVLLNWLVTVWTNEKGYRKMLFSTLNGFVINNARCFASALCLSSVCVSVSKYLRLNWHYVVTFTCNDVLIFDISSTVIVVLSRFRDKRNIA